MKSSLPIFIPSLFIRVFHVAILLCSLLAMNAHAQWSTNPAVNTPVYSTYTGEQSEQRIIPDGSGGIIVAWQDNRAGNWNIYAQRLSAAGVPMWTANGVAICTAANTQWHPAIVSDGAGGAYIAWEDYRLSSSGSNIDIYAQRINGSGVVQWTANGLAICTQTSSQYNPFLLSDGSTGAIVLWNDTRNGNYDIFTQKINAAGTAQWTANGNAVTLATASQLSIFAVTDGAGGAIVAWEDYRGGTDADIYAQRVNSLGNTQWTANGTVICNASAHQYVPVAIADGAGGAIIAWPDGRSGGAGVYAQRINASGTILWTANGEGTTAFNGAKSYTSICPDGAGGAILCWEDNRNIGNTDIYAQRFNASGTRLWAANGLPVCTAAYNQNTCTLCADGSGGGMVCWKDFRLNSSNAQLYSQRVNAGGAVQWTADGIATSTASSQKEYPHIVADGASGAILCWDDKRNGAFNPFAQKICSAGLLGTCPLPEINVTGNGVNIVSGDLTPSLSDHTSFGNVIIPNTFTRTFTIQNTGSAALTIASISLTGADAALFSIGTYPATVASASSATFIVTFNSSGSSVGLHTATINIVNNDADEGNYTFAVQANSACLAPALPAVVSSSSSNCGVMPTTLSVVSGALNSASAWTWYSGACGTGIPLGTGSSIVVTPAESTTYYVRGEGNCVSPGNCSSVSVAVTTCTLTLNVKALIEGYYASSGLMKPVLYNQGVSANQLVTDAILVELHAATVPYALLGSNSALMNIDGTFSCTFTGYTGSYYLVLKHRNGLETWSAQPIAIGTAPVSCDFTLGSSTAYGGNLRQVEQGIWAIYSGDLNNDENVDLLDLPNLESDIENYYSGYFSTDINGDGNVDLLDYPVMETNVSDFVASQHP